MTVSDLNEEQLPQQSTVDQLKRLRKATKNVTIDDKISDMNKQGANIQYIRNPVDSGVESYQDFTKSGDNSFTKIKPFKDYIIPQSTSNKKNKKK